MINEIKIFTGQDIAIFFIAVISIKISSEYHMKEIHKTIVAIFFIAVISITNMFCDLGGSVGSQQH